MANYSWEEQCYDHASDRVAQPALLFSAPWHNRAPCMNTLSALLRSIALLQWTILRVNLVVGNHAST